MATNTAPQTPIQNIWYTNLPPEQRLLATPTYDQRNVISGGFASKAILRLSISIITLGGVTFLASLAMGITLGGFLSYQGPVFDIIGLLVIIPTGIIGVFVYAYNTRGGVGQGLIVAFIITIIISAICSVYIAIWGVFFILRFLSEPEVGIWMVMIAVPVAASATAVLCIITCSLTLRGTFCSSSHTTAQFSAAGGAVRVMPANSMIAQNIPVNNSVQATPYQTNSQNVAATRPQMEPDSNPTPQATSVNMAHADNRDDYATGVGIVAGQDSNPSGGKPVANTTETWEKF